MKIKYLHGGKSLIKLKETMKLGEIFTVLMPLMGEDFLQINFLQGKNMRNDKGDFTKKRKE